MKQKGSISPITIKSKRICFLIEIFAKSSYNDKMHSIGIIAMEFRGQCISNFCVT